MGNLDEISVFVSYLCSRLFYLYFLSVSSFLSREVKKVIYPLKAVKCHRIANKYEGGIKTLPFPFGS